jgi:ATP-dependent Clp endopeptidase proteolytic subunit ClpP
MVLKINIDGYIDKYGGFSLSTLKSMVESNPDVTEIELFINSEGGDVIEGFAIHDYIQSLNKPVSVVIEGLCASIATVIALAVDKKKRKIYSNAKIMVHNPYWTPSAPIGMESDELSALASELEATENQLANFYVAKLGLSLDEVKAMMKSETWLTSSKALEIGFVDSIVNASIAARKPLPIKAQINLDMQKEFTAEQKSWLEQKLATIENGFKNLFKAKFKNMVVKLQDGSEVFVDTEDGDLMGKQVFVMQDGNMTDTPAPDGEHVTEDGRTIVVAGGVVTEVKEAEDVEALKTELATAQAQNAELQNQVAEVTNQLNEVKANFENTKTEFYNFKSQILNGEVEKAQDFPKGGQNNKELSLVEKALLIRKQNKQ